MVGGEVLILPLAPILLNDDDVVLVAVHLNDDDDQHHDDDGVYSFCRQFAHSTSQIAKQ